MSTVPEHELVALSAMTGFDQTLAIERLCQMYGVDEAALRAAMATSSPPNQTGQHHLTKCGTRHTRPSQGWKTLEHQPLQPWLTNANFDLNTIQPKKQVNAESR